MEDQVAYKVYTFWRERSKPEVRRFGIDKSVVSSYTYLLAKVHDVFPNLKEKTFSICWKDEEGDDVKISSDDEIMTMMTTVPQQLFKLYVYVENKTDGVNPHSVNVACAASAATPRPFVFASHSAPGDQPGHPGVHTGVRCDNCNRGVVGFRYKCISCEDFDLCSACEIRGAHSQHCFVRIPSPHMPVVVECIKKSRHVLKAFAARLFEAQKKHTEMAKTAACAAAATATAAASGAPAATMAQRFSSKSEAKLAAKERREERQEKRHEKHEKRQERRMEDRRERRENAHDRPSWVDVFSKYIDQFANLAADHIRVVTSAEQTSQTAETVPIVPIDQAEFTKMMTACMALRNSMSRSFETSEQEGASQETSEDTAQAPTAKSASAPSTSQMAPNQALNTPEAPTQAPTTLQGPTEAPITPQVPTTTPVMPQVAPNPVKPVEDTKADMSDVSSVSSAEGISQDSYPDKSAEDWTMINNYKELETDTSATNLVQIDSNLPEEFQLRPGGAYGFIYPALNAATAVYNPKEPVVFPENTEPAAPAQAPRTVQPPTRYSPEVDKNLPSKAGHGNGPATYAASMGQGMKNESSSAAPPPSAPVVEERQHRVPHIDAAIRQMIAMGFTNEGGWLTQLVESKDGNIAAVLDLLTPVQPPKK